MSSKRDKSGYPRSEASRSGEAGHAPAPGRGASTRSRYTGIDAPETPSVPARVGTHSVQRQVDPFAGLLTVPTEPMLPVMRKATSGAGATGATEHVAAAASSSGEALPTELRGRLEGKLGHDLGGVRVHTGPESSAASEAVAAKAYTQGQDIHFGDGQYDPSSKEGQRLVAHEVAHTVQQRGVSRPARQRKEDVGADDVGHDALDVSEPGDAHEEEADAFADAFVDDHAKDVDVTPGAAPAGELARKPKASAGGSKPVVITSAWDANGKRLKVLSGRSPWTGPHRVYNGTVTDGRIAWQNGNAADVVRVDTDGRGEGGQPISAWIPAGTTRVIVSAGRDYGSAKPSVHEPGGKQPVGDHSGGLTDKKLYGPMDRKLKRRKRAFDKYRRREGQHARPGGEKEWRKYEEITKTRAKKRFGILWEKYDKGGPTGFIGFFKDGLATGRFHKWEKRQIRRLYKAKEAKIGRTVKYGQYFSQKRAQKRFVNQAGAVKSPHVFFNEILLAPIVQGADIGMLLSLCADPKHKGRCLAVALTLKTKIKHQSRGASPGALAANKAKLRRLDKVIARTKRASKASSARLGAAVTKGGRSGGLAMGFGMLTDPYARMAVIELATELATKAYLSTRQLVLEINRRRIARDIDLLSDAEKVLVHDIAKAANDRHLRKGYQSSSTTGYQVGHDPKRGVVVSKTRPSPDKTPNPPAAAGPVFKTTADATAAAEKLGYRRINETSHGEAIYTDGRRYITRDRTGHNGGAWKMADSVRNLGSRRTRAGTYDAQLNRIGD